MMHDHCFYVFSLLIVFFNLDDGDIYLLVDNTEVIDALFNEANRVEQVLLEKDEEKEKKRKKEILFFSL
jgi:hypothetical protein